MNYLYNGEHQDLSNLRPRNLFKDLFSVQLLSRIKTHFSNVLLHYLISWLPLYELVANNKRFQAIQKALIVHGQFS